MIVDTKQFEAFLKQVVIERIKAGDIPDSKLIDSAEPIYLKSEIYCESGHVSLRMPSGFFPDTDGLNIKIMEYKKLNEIANKSGKVIYYYSIANKMYSEYEATLYLGVGCVAPDSDHGCMLCCCGAEATFWKAGGRWRFIEWDITICQ